MTARAIALGIALVQVTGTGTSKNLHVTGVRLDNAFRLVGSDSSGLVLTVRIDQLLRPTSTGDFTLVIFNDQGRPSGEVSCLATRVVSGADSKPQPRTLLDDSAGTLSRSYRAQTDTGTAIVEKSRRKSIDKPAVYEFVFLIGPSVKQGVLSYGENRPDVGRLPVGSFKVPWP